MKILHTADWHAGKTLRNRSRIAELDACIEEMAAIAENERVEVAIVAGDLFDAAAPTPEAEQAVYRGLLRLAQTVELVIVVAGNHDSSARLQAIAPVLSHVRVHTGFKILPAAQGGVLKFETKRGERVNVALLPFMSQRNAVRASDLMELDASQLTGKYAGTCSSVIGKLCENLDKDAVRLAVAHLHITGGTLGGGERLAHSIDDYHIPAQAFPSNLHYAALGHLHAPQVIPGACPIHYSGSPMQLDFGETETKNSVYVIEAWADRAAEIKPVLIKCGRKLKTLTGTLDSLPSFKDVDPESFLRLILSDDAVVGLADRARELFPNAVEVLVKPKQATSCAEQLDYDGISPSALFAMYLKEIGEKDARLLAEFRALSEEVDAAPTA